MLGTAASPFTNGLQRITRHRRAARRQPAGPEPADPSERRHLQLGRAHADRRRDPHPAGCRQRLAFAGGLLRRRGQQGQITLADGYYKFDVNFSDPACPSGGDYLIAVTAPSGANYVAGYSQIIPPTSDASTAAFSVPACPASADDAIPGTALFCEVQRFGVRAGGIGPATQRRHDPPRPREAGRQPDAWLEPDLQQPHPARSAARRRARDHQDDAAAQRDPRTAGSVRDHREQPSPACCSRM